MLKLRIAIAITVLAMGLVGCASQSTSGRVQPQALSGSSQIEPKGPPTVTIENTTPKQAMNVLSNRLMSQGWNVAQTNDYQAVYETEVKGAAKFAANVMYGSSGPAPIYRIVARFVDLDGSVRITTSSNMVTKPNTAREQTVEMNDKKSSANIRALLESVRQELTTRIPDPHPPGN